MWDDEGPPPRRRADQPWGDAEDRRFHEWRDLAPAEDAPQPPQPAQNGPRPALSVVPDPEPERQQPDALPDPVVGVRAWAARRLANIEAEIRYRRLVDKK